MAVITGDDAPARHDGTGLGDTINALGGNDTIFANGGDDRVLAGNGNDSIETGGGEDSIFGGSGNDTIIAAPGLSFLYGESGADYIVLNAPFGSSSGTDARAYGGADDDWIIVFSPVGAEVHGDDGVDHLSFGAFTTFGFNAAVSIDISTGSGSVTPIGGPGFSMTFTGIERLTFSGLGGNDSVIGGALNDNLYVGSGQNTVRGGEGDDVIAYRYGWQQDIDAGGGNDLLVTQDALQAVTFNVLADGSARDGRGSGLLGFERFEIDGSALNDSIATGTGNDTLRGFAGNDRLSGRAGNDVLVGGLGADTLNGGQDNDGLYGGRDDDLLLGGAGNDVLNGHLGQDTLTGGTGADRFVFRIADDGADLITDFVSGTDRIAISRSILDDAPPAPGRLAASQFADGAATLSEGQFIRSFDAGLNLTTLSWDSDGTGAASGTAICTFSGDVVITASDILLL